MPPEAPGPTFVLEGRVVTLDDAGTVLKGARVVVSDGAIAAVVPAGDALPDAFKGAPRVKTNGTIYPGLIDLHNHFVYNVLPLWTVPEKYVNRSVWQGRQKYSNEVGMPVRTLAEFPETAKALVRFVEAKALVGGTTAGQGMRTQVDGGARLFRGGMRNVEEPGSDRLAAAGTLVPSLRANEAEQLESFRNGLTKRAAYFYHLAEGVDDAAHQNFTDLVEHDLVRKSLVGIHSLGLKRPDLKKLASKGAKVVWSPFSNLLLYGQTLDLDALTDSKVPFSIGCDWSPTGSKNLLEELKVARWVVKQQQSSLTPEDLVRAVTSEAARVLSWDQHVGRVVPGALADLLVIDGDDGNPYTGLIDATEKQIALVVVDGVARYGGRTAMERLNPAPAQPLEAVKVAGRTKVLNLHAPLSDINDVTLAGARSTLGDAMADLPSFRDAAEAARARLLAMDVPPPFVVELDNEWAFTADELDELGPEAGLLADWSKMIESVPLDPLEVGAKDYWARVDSQNNIADGLKDTLRAAYG